MAKRKQYDWYDTQIVRPYGALFNLIIGARSLGKTYGFARDAIEDALKGGDQFIYLRRYREELADARNAFFAAVQVEFPGWEFKAVGKYAFARKAVFQRPDESDSEYKARSGDSEWKHIGFFVALSVAQGMKSVPFPKVKTIIFDEFIIEKGNTPYLPSEARALLNFYVTVDRNQERVKVYMLANAVSIMNPYTIEWNIDLTRVPEISTHHKGVVLVHLPESANFAKQVGKTRLGGFIENTAYGDYAMNNKFGDGHEELIARKDSKAVYKYTLETAKGTFSVWYLKRNQTFYVQEKLPKSQLVLTMVAENMSEDKTYVMYSDKILSYLRSAFRHGRVFADSPKTRNAFIEVFRR